MLRMRVFCGSGGTSLRLEPGVDGDRWIRNEGTIARIPGSVGGG